MKITILAVAAAVLAAATLGTGCREKIEARPPALEGDELITAAALRQHMRNHHTNYKTEYKYIFLRVLGEDPSRDFMDYFDDLFPAVLPASKMVETRYGFENLPATRGIWILFEVEEYEGVTDSEAWVTCRTSEHELVHPGIRYRLQYVDGQWRSTSIVSIDGEGNM